MLIIKQQSEKTYLMLLNDAMQHLANFIIIMKRKIGTRPRRKQNFCSRKVLVYAKKWKKLLTINLRIVRKLLEKSRPVPLAWSGLRFGRVGFVMTPCTL